MMLERTKGRWKSDAKAGGRGRETSQICGWLHLLVYFLNFWKAWDFDILESQKPWARGWGRVSL